jgi:murein DD-endopeptidase MepM/ murein hydrolase activator NlpD
VRPRAIGAVFAAAPVIALVYVGELRRRRVAARVATVAGVGALLAAGLAGFGGAEVAARPVAARSTHIDADFRPVVVLPVDASLTSDRSPAPGALDLGSVDFDAARNDPAPGPPLASQLIRQATVAPAVVRFRPRDGWTLVERDVWLSVRFTAPMDRRATTPAFHASVAGREIVGRTWWAEGDTVLVLDPHDLLPAGARVTLSVGARARSSAGIALAGSADAVFETVRPVAQRPARTASSPTTPSRSSSPPSYSRTTSGWAWPFIGPITQHFGQHLTKWGFHYGLDIDGDTGDPVRAARAGIVKVAGYADSCGGIQVQIDHGDGYLSVYHHLSATLVSPGQRVSRGAFIGRVGSTGCSTGSHLHFGIKKNGVWVDPERYLPPR